jgi:hypothetical protein
MVRARSLWHIFFVAKRGAAARCEGVSAKTLKSLTRFSRGAILGEPLLEVFPLTTLIATPRRHYVQQRTPYRTPQDFLDSNPDSPARKRIAVCGSGIDGIEERDDKQLLRSACFSCG